jgi:uncharacterized protein (DUF1800 family)
VREQARSLTGWRNKWKPGVGEYDFHLDATQHDAGMKTVFHKSGRYDWRAACKLCISHPLHPSFFVNKLWSYFVPTTPDRGTEAALIAIYRNGWQVRPVVQAILEHPVLYDGPRMVKPPIVHLAGLLRRIGAGITTTDWAWIGSLSGQQLFYPPNVAGWDDTRWLDTATFRGRWIAVERILQDRKLDPAKGKKAMDADTVLRRALAFWNKPALADGTHAALMHYARAALGDAGKDTWKQQQYPVLVENALRQLIAISPELQTS